MFYKLNKKANKRHKYYFSKDIKVKSNFYISKNYIVFLLISLLSFTAVFFGKNFIYTNYAYNSQDRSKIHNLIFALDEIYLNNHFSEKELHELASHVIKNSKEYIIEPELILAIISVESSFNKKAVSHKGALGLMQIMPNTFMEAAKELGIENNGNDSIYDLENNVRIGTHYLAKLNKKYKNNIKLSLTAYNEGPRNLDNHLKNKEPVSYKYFNKVMENYKKFIL